MKKTFIILGAAIIVLLIIVAVVKRGNRGGEDVETTKVKTRAIVEKVSASGKIFPEVEVVIIPEISGEIIGLLVDEGDSVRKGDPLVKINPSLYQDAVEQARAAVYTAQANLGNARARAAQAEAQLQRAELEYNRSNQLHKDGVISQSEYETAVTNFNVAKAELEAAKETVNASSFNVRSAEAMLNEAVNNLGKTTIYAPMSGVVSSLDVEEGKVVGGIAQFAATEMMRIANFSEMEVRVDVSENDILRIGIGDTAEIEVEAYPEKLFMGEVTQISSSANQQGALTTEQATNFTVKIRILRSSYVSLINLESGNAPFLPGMSASVEIITARKPGVLSVPIEAVTTRDAGDVETGEAEDAEEEEGGNADATRDNEDTDRESIRTYVFIFENEKAHLREVKTGIQDDEYIEITSGLVEGEEVIFSPYEVVQRRLKDGQEVQRKLVEQED